MKNFQIFSIAMAVALLLTACGSSPTPTPATVSATETPKPSETPTMTATASSTPTQTSTPTPLPPMVVVGGAVPCYSEWSTDSTQVTTFNVKNNIQVLAKNEDDTFLLVKATVGDSSCWLETKYATWISSDLTRMAAILPTATATPARPDVAQNIKVNSFCYKVKFKNQSYDYFVITISLLWDVDASAKGYRIYKEGDFVAELGQVDSYTESWQSGTPDSGQYIYGIQVFNSVGESQILEYVINYSCK